MVNWQRLSFSLFPKEVLGLEQMGGGHPFLDSRADLPSRTEGTCAGELKFAAGSYSQEVLLEVPPAQPSGMD